MFYLHPAGEGTQATLKEVLKYEAEKVQSSEKQGDIKEIINYRKALFAAKSRLDSQPLSLRLIREMHVMIVEDVVGAPTCRLIRIKSNDLDKIKGSNTSGDKSTPSDYGYNNLNIRDFLYINLTILFQIFKYSDGKSKAYKI